MTLEFAIRQRIRLDEPKPKPRRARLRVPAIAFPIAGYWLITGVLTYVLVFASKADAGTEQRSTESRPRKTHVKTAKRRRVAKKPAPLAAPEPALVSATRLPPQDNSAVEQAEETAALEPEPHDTIAPASRKHASQTIDEPFEAAARPSTRKQTEPPLRDPIADVALWPTTPRAFARDEPSKPDARETTIEDPFKTAPPKEPSRAGSLPSCEAAIASSNQELEFGALDKTPDLSRDAFASVLENGRYFSHCAPSDRTSLEICVAVQAAQVKGVSVVTIPANPQLVACVRRAVSSLRFPYSPRLDITRTRFDAVK